MMDSQIRLALSDASRFLSLYQTIFPHKKIFAHTIENIFLREPAEVWATQSPTDILTAFLYFWRVPDGFEIIDIGAHPDFRKRGLATLLLQALIVEARANQKNIFLEVAQGNLAARNLYAKLGFAVSQIRPDYYANREAAYVLVWKPSEES